MFPGVYYWGKKKNKKIHGFTFEGFDGTHFFYKQPNFFVQAFGCFS